MSDIFGGQHTSQKYDQELRAHFNHLLKMGSVFEEMFNTVLDSLWKNSSEITDLLKFTQKKEQRINRMEVEIDQRNRDIFTRRAPVASDFRLLTGTAKIILDIERMGDETKKIARYVSQILSSDYSVQYKENLRQLAEDIKTMVRETTTCLSQMNETSAKQIIIHDKLINKSYDEICKLIIQIMKETPEHIETLLDVIWTARSIERIGDHCRNIAESVIFIVEGKDIRHKKSTKKS